MILYECGGIEMIKEIITIIKNLYIKIKMFCQCRSSCQIGNEEKNN
jgi:hypothetical protein